MISPVSLQGQPTDAPPGPPETRGSLARLTTLAVLARSPHCPAT
eukprot:CAMPEP_0202095694 /NCGR_PEP_ID=MMETSP0965-20130614/146_1 /ASSEMBLY_ACC=CAM_ASM_000507 /TAXON_ID=4773 /ORGANISM="Schizochytrium aggregatum, Strain ATCC28209" /LENGTH=43 /DNA_ID= /DNA_START= /DNA_END= /DNA_ORIENTATION=